MLLELVVWLFIVAGATALAALTYLVVEHWHSLREQVRKALPYLGAGLSVVALLGLWVWQWWQLINLSRSLAPEVRVPVEIEALKIVPQVLGGGILLCGVYLTLRRVWALERQVEVAQEGQVTERFTRAIEQLGSDKLEVRLGGIYALERIAKDSEKDYWTIMEVLTAFIRENAPWPPKEGLPPAEGASGTSLEETSGDTESSESAPKPKPRTDIQAALTVLGRRSRRYGQGEDHPLNLSHTDLRGADLREAHLEGANLFQAHLESANLWQAHLENANLWQAHLENADLLEAHLEEVILGGSKLNNAILEEAKLQNSYLVGVNFENAHLLNANLRNANLKSAQMMEANLKGANLEKANLIGAILHYAKIDNANLKGANLAGAKGLTWEQLEYAYLDENTRLPDYLPPRPAGSSNEKEKSPQSIDSGPPTTESDEIA
ncbi:MAG: pentapeptide repeat-containing protein [Desulfobaccales bacterium]